MARWRRVAGWTVVSLVVLIAVAITATVGWRPFIGPAARPLTDRTFAPSPERLARGKYLFTSVDGCPVCHTARDRSIDGMPPKAGLEGSGRNWADEAIPWLNAPNITPDMETGAGTWTDDQLARAIREGIGHDGRALFPLMPYQSFRAMSDEDLASVIVYLRTLPAIRHELAKTKIPFPPGPLINSVPQPLTEPVPQPDRSTLVKRGEYTARIALCSECHSPIDDRGAKIPGTDFAGGFQLNDVDGHTQAWSANLTPDPSGIPYYNEDLFLQTIRSGRVVTRELSDMMPWALYRNMTDDDLKSIFAFLQTLKPIKHTVDNKLPATLCPVCNLRHGGGDANRKPS